jgi:hypothetical protein
VTLVHFDASSRSLSLPVIQPRCTTTVLFSFPIFIFLRCISFPLVRPNQTGDQGSGAKIPGGSVLIFEMEIMKIKDTSKAKLALKCDYVTAENCNDKEIKFIEKVKKDWSADEKIPKAQKEMERLTKIITEGGSKTKADLVQWLERRLHILKQVVKAADTDKEL